MSRRCLFLVEDWALGSDAPGGAAGLIRSHLDLLLDAGVAVDLLQVRDSARSLGFERWAATRADEVDALRRRCRSWTSLDVDRRRRPSAPLRNALRAWRDPSSLVIEPTAESGRALLDELSGGTGIVWAEHLVPATLVRRLTPGRPWVYGHHDWSWRLRALRGGGPAARFKTALRRRYEERLVGSARACVSGSATEAATIRRLGGWAEVLPASFASSAGTGGAPFTAPASPRLVHLGGMRTTANRVGLARFVERVLPRLRTRPTPPLWVVGSLDGAPDQLRAALRRAGAHTPGFVDDLGTVLRPGDLHVVPWEHDTGTRTRIPLALAWGQTVVSTRAAAAGFAELADGLDCRLVADLEAMAPAIDALLAAPAKATALAQAGRATFERCYTPEAQRPRFSHFLAETLPELAGAPPELAAT